MTSDAYTEEDDAVMTFGKYAEQAVSSVPDSYLLWCAKNMPRIPCYVVNEMDRRGMDVDSSWTSSTTVMAGVMYFRPSDSRDREIKSHKTKKGMKFWRRQGVPCPR
jgi:hypothetical protein